ncbi:MAG: hypothetical protein KA745_07540, partial [Gemmatimonadales bacterium]|nr:hypothetical protein [Gemmatimonadales bacterium]
MSRHLIAMALFVGSLGAQTPRPITAAPTAFPTTFSSIMHFAELRDGRVLIFDAVERKFSAADFR